MISHELGASTHTDRGPVGCQSPFSSAAAFTCSKRLAPGPRHCRRRLAAPPSCSIPPSAYQAAERRASAQRCSTSYSSGSSSDATSSPACAGSSMPRRGFMLHAAGLLFAAAGLHAQRAQASKLPPALDRAWEAVGGGPADLFFPEDFLGLWNVESVLTSVKLPLGPDFVPDPKVVERAQSEDLNRAVQYRVSFIRNAQGRIITDRRFNTLSLLDHYLGPGQLRAQDIDWNPNDPNVLQMALPGGLDVVTRVTRRSEAQLPENRLDTSEYFEQVYAAPARREPRVKASQCFTKYRWRDGAAALRETGPQIVATQVVSDFLTPYDGEMLMLRAQNSPVVMYTYRMRFWRDSGSPRTA